MTLYNYVNPVSEANPNNKCVIYLNKDIIYAGSIGNIPFKFGNLQFDKVLIQNKTLIIFLKGGTNA